jgi:hypothetical protein
MTDKLLPCPFCGADLLFPYHADLNVAKHPEGTKCFAGKSIVYPQNRAAWNTRSPINDA